MDNDLSDDNGADGDPPSRQNRFRKCRRQSAGKGKSAVSDVGALPRVHSDKETQIHDMELEAYYYVIRAFKAKSESISWEQEGLFSDLRKELNVSVEEHRMMLSRVDGDGMVNRIREWRKASGHEQGLPSTSNPFKGTDSSPIISASRKKKETKQRMASLSSIMLRCDLASTSKNMNLKYYPSAGVIGRPHEKSSLGAYTASASDSAAKLESLIGKKVGIRWPCDDKFYEATINYYDPAKGLHELVYDIRTEKERRQWINIKEISPEDIKLEGEHHGVSLKVGLPIPGQAQGPKNRLVYSGNPGGMEHQPMTASSPLHLGLSRKGLGNIEILQTDILVGKLEKLLSMKHPNPEVIEEAKRVLKKHEEDLEEAIARLGDVSDDASDGARDPP